PQLSPALGLAPPLALRPSTASPRRRSRFPAASAAPRRRWPRSCWPRQNHRRILPSEAEGVGERDVHTAPKRSLANHPEVAFWIRLAVIRCSWKDLAREGQQAGGDLDRAGRSHQMSDRALDRADRN